MSIPDVKLGDIFWCIAASEESQAYGDASCRPPWRGKITAIYDPDRVQISDFDEETGEPDDDRNASAIVRRSELFPDLPRAVLAYKLGLLDEFIELERQQGEKLKALEIAVVLEDEIRSGKVPEHVGVRVMEIGIDLLKIKDLPDREQFRLHGLKAAALVSTWPEWKQNLLGKVPSWD